MSDVFLWERDIRCDRDSAAAPLPVFIFSVVNIGVCVSLLCVVVIVREWVRQKTIIPSSVSKNCIYVRVLGQAAFSGAV